MIEVNESKNFVLEDWETGGESELVASVHRLLSGREEALRIQCAIVVIPITIAVKRVGA